MENIWIRRELGDAMYLLLNQPWCTIRKQRRDSTSLPADIYKRVDVYAEVEASRSTWFALSFPQATVKEKIW
jgi:hypothetical protein|tara:strand:- start:232 stop:447 length:216 start_codon:yes stop_codon:yes gene_type:complete